MIFVTDHQKEYLSDENCFITEVCREADSPISIAQARVLPGQYTEWHYLQKSTEYYYILAGSGLAEMDKESFLLNRGDVLKILPGTHQRIKNIAEKDLIFLCICQPPFTESDYFQISETALD